MQIKITNVTSVPPELFADEAVADGTAVPEVVDIDSDNEEISYHLSMAQTTANGHQGTQSNGEKRPATPDLNTTDDSSADTISAELKRPRTELSHQESSADDSNQAAKPYSGGVSLSNAASIKVNGQHFVVPREDDSRVRVNGTWVPVSTIH